MGVSLGAFALTALKTLWRPRASPLRNRSATLYRCSRLCTAGRRVVHADSDIGDARANALFTIGIVLFSALALFASFRLLRTPLGLGGLGILTLSGVCSLLRLAVAGLGDDAAQGLPTTLPVVDSMSEPLR
jgi:uncharacterized membrane protein YgdD (TMEM256/DUF423 family)